MSQPSKTQDAGAKLGGWMALGLKEAPLVTKVVIGATVLCLATVLLLKQNVPPTTLFVSAFVVLIIGLIASLLSSALLGKTRSLLGHVLAWGLSGCFLAVMVLFVSATFFGWPPGGAILLARIFGPSLIPSDSSLQPVRVQGSMTLENFLSLHSENSARVSSNDRVERESELAKLPPIVIEGVLTISDAAGAHILRASSIEFRGGSIVTNGAVLKIETRDLLSNGGRIVSFDPPVASGLGTPGRDGGRVELRVSRKAGGVLAVTLPGTPGGQGNQGNPGSKGATGRQGDNAASHLFDCAHGAGRGGDGSPGGRGGDGEAGGHGGNGGDLQLIADNPATLADHVTFAAPGGSGGAGGEPGAGGPGGAGGAGGEPRGLCQGHGPSGATGAQGPSGNAGAPGLPGQAGKQTLVEIASVPAL